MGSGSSIQVLNSVMPFNNKEKNEDRRDVYIDDFTDINVLEMINNDTSNNNTFDRTKFILRNEIINLQEYIERQKRLIKNIKQQNANLLFRIESLSNVCNVNNTLQETLIMKYTENAFLISRIEDMSKQAQSQAQSLNVNKNIIDNVNYDDSCDWNTIISNTNSNNNDDLCEEWTLETVTVVNDAGDIIGAAERDEITSSQHTHKYNITSIENKI